MAGNGDRLDAELKAKKFNKYLASHDGFDDVEEALDEATLRAVSVSATGEHPLSSMETEETVEMALSGVAPSFSYSLPDHVSGVGVGFNTRTDTEASLRKPILLCGLERPMGHSIGGRNQNRPFMHSVIRRRPLTFQLVKC